MPACVAIACREVHVLLAEARGLALDVDHAVVGAVVDERRAHPRAHALVVLVVAVAQEDAAAVAHDVLDDRARDAQVAAEALPAGAARGDRARAVLLHLHLELAGLLVLDEDAHVLGLGNRSSSASTSFWRSASAVSLSAVACRIWVSASSLRSISRIAR